MEAHDLYFLIANFFMGLSVLSQDAISKIGLLFIGIIYFIASFRMHHLYLQHIRRVNRLKKLEAQEDIKKLLESKRRRRKK